MNQKLKSMLARFGKYKYTVLILLLGVGLMLLPQGDKEPVQEPAPQLENTDLETRLENLLRQVDGAGNVDVLLTYSEGVSYEYQTNQKKTADEMETETVLVSGGGTEAPVTVRTRYPIYQGAVILCQGADSAAVRMDIVNAVSSLTGLGSDKISVIKMISK